MRLFAISFIISICCITGFTQVNTNPFEIKSRLDSVYNFDERSKSSTTNIFDVQRSDDNIISLGEEIVPDTLMIEQESDLVPSVGEELEIDESNVQIDDNPFDVSHIPIRKSKLKAEADAFKTSNKQISNQNSKGSNAFLFWLNLLTALIFAIVVNTQKGAIKKISNAITNENVLKLIQREEKKGISGYNLLLYISFFINAAIFGYLLLYNFYEIQGWLSFQWVFLGILGTYMVRHIFLNLIGKVFPFKKDSQLYGFTIQTFNIFIGIILIPFNLIIAFGPEKTAIPLIYLGLVIVGILALLRAFRGFLIASTYIQSNLFHFLLYLCTFEILPILLFIKIIGNFEIA